MRLPLIAATILFAAPASAQDYQPVERHIWHTTPYFQPLSRTAQAITGPLAISGLTLWLGPSKPLAMTPISMAWREWDTISGKETGEIFRLSRDPGRLEQGNTLCGNSPATHIVLYETDGGLGMSAFKGSKTPKDANGPDLCGTFYYSPL